MNAEELWKESGLPGKYGTFSFGSDDPNGLIALTIKDVKHATTGALRLYELDKEPVPEAGEYYIITDDEGNAHCIVKDVNVIICPFKDVTEEMAAIEGEGDKSLRYWKEAHHNFFSIDFKERGLEFSESEQVVFEQYKLVYLPAKHA